ncbi:MAG: histidine kinase [Prevotella sp.]
MMKHLVFPSWKDIALYLELWLLAMVLSYVYFNFIELGQLTDPSYRWKDFLVDGLSMLVFIGVSLIFNWIFISLFQPLQHYLGKLFLYSVLLLIVNTIVATLYSMVWDMPQQEYIKSIYMFSLVATFISSIHANILFQKAYRKEVETQHHLQLENARQKEVNLQTTLMALKSQVDPHFLFNNLSILSELIEENPDDARSFLDSLSRVYRYKLVNMNGNLVSVHHELQMLRSYVDLIQNRFGQAILVNFPQVEPENCQIPPLAIQTLVENAIKHNAHSQSHPLIIDIKMDGLHVMVSNALQPLSSDVESTGLGLANLRSRYKLLSGRTIQVKNDGKCFIVTIPLINKKK